MDEPFDQIDPLPDQPKSKKPLGIVVFANFCIMLSYTMFFWVSEDIRNPYAGLEDLVMNALYLAGQVVLNLLIGFALTFDLKYKHIGSAMLIGGVITALIGFGTCIAAQDYF